MSPQEDFAALFEASLHGELPEEGDIVKGKVISILKDVAIIDFGHKQEGQVQVSEFRIPGGGLSIKVGDEIEAYLENLENEEGLAILSKEKAEALKIWDHLQSAMENDTAVDGTVVGKVKGGLSVDIGVKAFLPSSQIDTKGMGSLDRMLGRKMKFKILKLNKRKGNIIVSRRSISDKNREGSRQDLLQTLAEGQTIQGSVKNLTDYGAFIDLGGVDGLLHITDMSWGRVGHPSDLLTVGQETPVKILKVDLESGKVSLGLKQLSKDPWEGVPQQFPVGARAKGRVANVTDYGAFVELAPGVEGLVHISEMTWSRKVKHPSKIVAVGDSIETAILDLDLDARRISLGMKQLLENPWEAIAEKYPVGSKVKGPVRSVTDFGVFVGLSAEIDGLIHISDLFWVRPGRPLNEIFQKGKEIEGVILSVDRENERISVGVKQLSEDPWIRVKKDYTIGTQREGKLLWRGDKGIAVGLEERLEGFINRADLSEELLPSLKVGEMMPVVVHSLDERDRKILLGLAVNDAKKGRS